MFFNVDYTAKKTDWKGFEAKVSDVFDKFGYTVKTDVRLTKPSRFQIDLVAYDGHRCFVVDCKDHFYISPLKEEEFILKQQARANALINSTYGVKAQKYIVLLVTRNKSSLFFRHEEQKSKIYSVDYASLSELLKNIQLYEDELITIKKA